MLDFAHPYTSWAVALGIGLLIGAERERRKGTGPHRSPAGIRTFAITALLGSLSVEMGGQTLLSITAAGLLGLTALAYYRDRSDDPGLTTEIALVLTLLLGALTVGQAATAAALAIIVTALLAARAPMHRFVREVLTEAELKSALVLGAATLVVWPVIPDRYFGPFDAINPRSIWSIVILVMAISACGHIAIRALGTRYGLPLAGLASGFVSSNATIASMGARVAEEPRTLGPASAGAVLSTVATIAQITAIVAATSPATLAALALPLIFAGLAAVSYGLVYALRVEDIALQAPAAESEAFSIKTAIILAATFVVVLVLVAAVKTSLGDRGMIVAAAAAGLADAHAIAMSAASQVAAGRMSPSDACLPILVGLTTNSITKIILATTSGSWPFALRVVPGILFVVAAAWTGILMSSR